MAVTVNDLLKLDIMKNFKVVAGANGLDKTVNATEILDFEFIQEGEEYRDESFIGNSVVLTSLLFAKDKPELVLDAVKKLNHYNVHALAYKPVIYKKLPQEALDYADKIAMPVLEFGNDEFFEDIIFALNELTRKTGDLERIEPVINEMLRRKFSKKECDDALEIMNPMLRPYIMACCIKCSGMDSNQILRVIKFASLPEKLQRKIFIGECQNKYIIIVSDDTGDKDRLNELADECKLLLGINDNKILVGVSKINALADGIDSCISQAYWSEKFAEIEGVNVRHFEDLGINQLLVPWPDPSKTEEFSERYLEPLLKGNGNDELLKTAIQYVLARGDMNLAAEKLYCHKNTVRYRVGKLQEKLAPKASEKTFFRELSAAVIIYLLKTTN